MKSGIAQSKFLADLESQCEEQLQLVISDFQNMSEAQLLQKPAQGAWSIAECFQHLNTYAAFYLSTMSKVLNVAADSNEDLVFRHSLLGAYFIRSMDDSRTRKKYKAIKKHRPENFTQSHQVIAEFIQHMESFLDLMHIARHKRLSKLSVKTSISPLIKINMGDAMQFLLTHNLRHINQARRILL
ncbi:MAG TPA: DinB family protein [Cyclobacteriaceae bacterium]|nr:DinB family protein [Cyclobacteriaceae bacterium]